MQKPPRKKRKNKPSDISEEEKQLFLEAVNSLGKFGSDLINEKFDPVETRTFTRRKQRSSSLRGEGEQAAATLDLHGLARGEAISRLEQFCRLSIKRGRLTLTIITGRGIHSQGRKSVLREAVIRWLNSEQGRKLVEAYRPGFPHQGGDGVLILYLHKTSL